MWAAVSTPIINILRQLCGGIAGRTPITNHPIQIVSFSFVDNLTLLEGKIGELDTNPQAALQSSSDIWDEAINASGGMISATKSWGQVVEFIGWSKN